MFTGWWWHRPSTTSPRHPHRQRTCLLSAPAPNPAPSRCARIDGGARADRRQVTVDRSPGGSSPRWPDRGPVKRPRAGLAGMARTSSNAIIAGQDGAGGRHRLRPAEPPTPAASPATRPIRRAQGRCLRQRRLLPLPDGLDGAVDAGPPPSSSRAGSIRDDRSSPPPIARPRHGLHRRAPLPPLMTAITDGEAVAAEIKGDHRRRSRSCRQASRPASAPSSWATTGRAPTTSP